jgi:hypothetical protein
LHRKWSANPRAPRIEEVTDQHAGIAGAASLRYESR